MTMPDFDHPFHKGELDIQDRLGVRDRVHKMGQRAVRSVLIDQHRAFYAELPFLTLGSVDGDGRPWASIVTGQPGFLSTPDDVTLDVRARPVTGDPLAENLSMGADIGVVGMQLETRRRNRMSGRISDVREDGFSIRVLQSYGNCPQYIQTRAVTLTNAPDPKLSSGDQFDRRTQEIITASDTLFIATSFRDDPDAVNQGTDASHRGGKPGFVKLEDSRTLIFPDFKGNNIYNTIGNIAADPRAGVLIPDFQNRDLVTMTGRAEIIWDGPEVDAFDGAQRLVRFRADQVHRITDGLALSTEFLDYAPQLVKTGAWAA